MLRKLGFIVLLVGFSMISISQASDGPTIRDVKTALRSTGIEVGAKVTLGNKSYTLESIVVSKAGPETFVVTFTTK